jgi:hypothetical protein
MWTQSPDYCSVIKNIFLATHTIVCGMSCHTVLLEEERKKETNKQTKGERKKKRKNEGKNEIKKKGRKEGTKK